MSWEEEYRSGEVDIPFIVQQVKLTGIKSADGEVRKRRGKKKHFRIVGDIDRRDRWVSSLFSIVALYFISPSNHLYFHASVFYLIICRFQCIPLCFYSPLSLLFHPHPLSHSPYLPTPQASFTRGRLRLC